MLIYEVWGELSKYEGLKSVNLSNHAHVSKFQRTMHMIQPSTSSSLVQQNEQSMCMNCKSDGSTYFPNIDRSSIFLVVISFSKSLF